MYTTSARPTLVLGETESKMAEGTPKFTFQYLGGKKFWSLDGKDENELYAKW